MIQTRRNIFYRLTLAFIFGGLVPLLIAGTMLFYRFRGDMEQVILEQAHIQGENVKTQEEKITVKGKLEFQVLYRKENGGLETLGGNIPFEETVNVPGLAE